MQRYFFDVDDIKLSEFASLCSQTVSLEDYNFSSDIKQRVVIYEGDNIRSLISTPQALDLKTELHHCIKEGPGVVVVRQAFQDMKVIDRATEIFQEIIDEEKPLTNTEVITLRKREKTSVFGMPYKNFVSETLKPSLTTITTLFFVL